MAQQPAPLQQTTPLPPLSKTQPFSDQPEKEKGSGLIRLLVVILVILGIVIAVLLYFLYQGRQTQNQNAPQATVTPTTMVSPGEQSSVEITTDDEFRYITGNGLPDHETGQFPNVGNPNTISVQDYNFRVTLNPEKADVVTEVSLGIFGVAVNGVPFDPGTDEWYNDDQNSGWQYDALSGAIDLGLDENNAHVQPSGAYHYHGLPTALIAEQTGGEHSTLIGWAADGFPIYALYGYTDKDDDSSGIKELQSGYQLKSGERESGPGGVHDGTFNEDWEFKPGTGDLDRCNGRNGVTPDYPDGTYAYFITSEYPFIPRCWRGTPDNSFLQGDQ
ncbi:MAG: YHYH protein [Candidatus Dojkabacteria bacterium]